MKRLYIIFLAGALVACFTACQEKELNPESVIIDSEVTQNAFDKWIYDSLVLPYNLEIVYRMLDTESDMTYNLAPAKYENSVIMGKLVKHLCLETYDEATGSKAFIRSYFPKMLYFVGSAAHKNTGTIVNGTAEAGRKISLYRLNEIDLAQPSTYTYYFKTLHHEFTHILNQTKPFSKDFDQLTGTAYVGDECWDTYSTETAAHEAGFISRYASDSPTEDFAEMVSRYITNSEETWEEWMVEAAEGTTKAGDNSRDIIEQKLEIVKNYMKNSWNLDMDELRAITLRRQSVINTLKFTVD